jgi:sterol desaturase/sphingolipid hydroxylase (fatty acid hydroxylase superfamily)
VTVKLSELLFALEVNPTSIRRAEAIIFAFLAHMIVRNVLGHAGVELLPHRWLAGWWGRWLMTTQHHDLHHAQARHDFDPYFAWWDRICGTEQPAAACSSAKAASR